MIDILDSKNIFEIEVFQREPSCGVHTLKIWINSNLVHANEVFPARSLVELRDALQNEISWLNDYLDENPRWKND